MDQDKILIHSKIRKKKNKKENLRFFFLRMVLAFVESGFDQYPGRLLKIVTV